MPGADAGWAPGDAGAGVQHSGGSLWARSLSGFVGARAHSASNPGGEGAAGGSGGVANGTAPGGSRGTWVQLGATTSGSLGVQDSLRSEGSFSR
jgi:hypothetical protein